MATTEVELYGKPTLRTSFQDEGYESPDEYAEQGDTRIVRDLLFSYLAATQDAGGNTVLTPVDVPRDTEVSIDQIGLLALEKGERHHSFYTDAELAAKQAGSTPGAVDVAALNPSEAGEYELAEWLQTGKDGGPFTINEVLDTVGDDKEFAHRMLQAENIATNGNPRKGLEEGLGAIIRS
jgi:hypothetical protein